MGDETLFPLPPSGEMPGEVGVPGVARVLRANRSQLEFRPVDLDGLSPADHRARMVWDFVQGLNLAGFYAEILSVEGHAGRPAIDPAILLSLWLYATLQGVGSARALARLCAEHDAYRWLAGGVSVNPHTLADFRVGHVEKVDALLTQSVASLLAADLVQLERVAQDGVRVRASAGAASFRRQGKLEACLTEAQGQVEALRRELEEDPGATSKRQAAARQRAAQERRERVAKALAQMPAVEAKKKAKDKDKARVSTTDPESRVMKMADGGFRPAYNGQFATDTKTQVVLGVDVNNQGNDLGQMQPMMEQIQRRYGTEPAEWLVDGGFVDLGQIEQASERGCVVYAPVMQPRDPSRDPHQALPGDSAAIAAWRARMGGEVAKGIYKARAATAECVNAIARNRGLQQLRVRGARRARAVLLWFALAHNLMRGFELRVMAAAGA